MPGVRFSAEAGARDAVSDPTGRSLAVRQVPPPRSPQPRRSRLHTWQLALMRDQPDRLVDIVWPAGATRDGPVQMQQSSVATSTTRADLPCFLMMSRSPECLVILTRTARHPVQT
jgi:hypothetical protein